MNPQGGRPGSGFVTTGQQAKGAAQAPSIVVSADNVSRRSRSEVGLHRGMACGRRVRRERLVQRTREHDQPAERFALQIPNDVQADRQAHARRLSV